MSRCGKLPDTRRPGRWALSVAVITGLLLAFALSGRAAAEPTVTAALAFTIGDPRITESSGLARDTDNTVFWTANDSGDTGVVYAIGPDGRTRGTVEYSTDPLDVEALAYADGRLYIADIGDNERNRESVQIYVIDSPVPGVDRGSDFTTYEFAYPDGPHDAEAIAVDDNGQLWIITKEARGGIYRAPRTLSRNSVNQLARVADAPAYVTDATMLPNGQLAVRTYLSVEVIETQLYAPVARSPLPFQRQGESITVSLAGNALLIGTEGPSSPVMRVPIPTQLAAVPTARATPPESPTPTATPTPEAEPGAAAPNRTGTLVALGLALLLSIGAGLVVFLRDRHAPPPPPREGPRRGHPAPPSRAATWDEPDEDDTVPRSEIFRQ